MTLQEMQTKRQSLLDQIHAKGGVAKAPKLAAQLTALESDIRAARNTQTSTGTGNKTPTPTKSLADQQARLNYLQKVRPTDPQIATLKKQIAAEGKNGVPASGDTNGGTNPGANPGANPGGNTTTVEQPGASAGSTLDAMNAFIDAALNNVKPYSSFMQGAPKLLTEADLAGERQDLQNSYYNQNSQYLERNKERALEQSKSELAARGIPYDPAGAFDPNTKSLYGKTIGAINENYAAQDQKALDDARTAAGQDISNELGANTQAYNAFSTNAANAYTGQYQSIAADQNLINSMVQQFGITEDQAKAQLAARTSLKVAQINNQRSGGGRSSGGSSDNTGFGITPLG